MAIPTPDEHLDLGGFAHPDDATMDDVKPLDAGSARGTLVELRRVRLGSVHDGE